MKLYNIYRAYLSTAMGLSLGLLIPTYFQGFTITTIILSILVFLIFAITDFFNEKNIK